MYAIFYFDRTEYRQRPYGGYNSDGTITIKRFETVKDAQRFLDERGIYKPVIQRHAGTWVTGQEEGGA